MLTTDRRTQILEILRQNGSVTVSGLAEKFETSESTIRRDLLALSQLGKINKVHGGATALGQEFLHNEEDFNEKSLLNINEKEEIAECDGIILAADKNVEMARFDGKPVVKASVSNGINKPEELIKKIVDGKASVYHADESEKQSVDDAEKESGGTSFISTL